MKDWKKIWDGLLETADSLGVSRYTMGSRLFGKTKQNTIYRKNLRVCRCLCEDLFLIIKDEIEKGTLLNEVKLEEKKTVSKKIKQIEKTLKTVDTKVFVETADTETTIKTAIDELKAMRVQPLIETIAKTEEQPKTEDKPEVQVEEVVEDVIEEPIKPQKEMSLYEQYYAILPESIAPSAKYPNEDTDEFTPMFTVDDEPVVLFERVDAQSFVLEDWFYRMQYPFKILDGRKEVGNGDHILLYIKTNGTMKPYILSTDQFKEFVATGKVNHWFSCRVPKAVWERTKEN